MNEIMQHGHFAWGMIEQYKLQDIVFVCLALLGSLSVVRLSTYVLGRGLARFFAKTTTPIDDALARRGVHPLSYLIALWLFDVSCQLLPTTEKTITMIIPVKNALYIFVAIWFLFVVVDVFFDYRQRTIKKRSINHIMPLLRRFLKIFLGVILVVFLLQNYGVDVAALLAGLGIGGIALALAGQKTVENLFGGISLILDQPVRVGDFCKADTLLGTVEDVGLRSTRIRTLDRTVITVPNAQFSEMQIENYARRERIHLRAILGIRYETTPNQMRWVLAELRKMLVAHEKIDVSPNRVRFVAYGAYSLDIEIFCYVLTDSWDEFLAVREDVYLRIMEIMGNSGTCFAFPSQTIYKGEDRGNDDKKTKAAEKQVKDWQKNQRQFMPDLSEEEKKQLRGTLHYPTQREK